MRFDMENAVPHTIWQFWTGGNAITENRVEVLKSNSNIGV